MSKLGRDLIKAMREVLAIQRGEIEPVRVTVVKIEREPKVIPLLVRRP